MNLRKATSYIKPVASFMMNAVLPPHSLITGTQLGAEEAENWQGLTFLDAPCCDVCGYPFEFAHGEGMLCGRCMARPPRYDRGRSAIVYNEHSRKLVLDFKHGGRTDGLGFFAAQMQRAGQELLSNTDIIVPVPLHPARLRKRRFNQSALLARAVSQRSGIPYNTDLLFRKKNTPSQGAQTFLGRRRNMVGAFHISTKNKAAVSQKNILLIDDVLTSGATLEACAGSLKRAGAAQVYILTLMRVVMPVTVAT